MLPQHPDRLTVCIIGLLFHDRLRMSSHRIDWLGKSHSLLYLAYREQIPSPEIPSHMREPS